jgi:hypothetical protein
LHYEDVWTSVCIDLRFLDLNTSWSWVASFESRPLYLGESAHLIHWVGDLVHPRTGLDTEERRKILSFQRLQFGHLVSSQSLCLLCCTDTSRTKRSLCDGVHVRGNSFGTHLSWRTYDTSKHKQDSSMKYIRGAGKNEKSWES